MADQTAADRVKAILERRANAYRLLVQSPGWPDCLQEMLAFAGPERCAEPSVRAGRLDMIAHIIRAADTAGNILTPGAPNGA